MKKITIILLFGFSFFAQSQNFPSVHLKAAEFSEALVTEDFDRAMEYFAPIISDQVDANKLKEIWSQIQGPAGVYLGKAAVNVMKEGELLVSYQPLTFDFTILDLKLTFDDSESIAGILFVPHKELEINLIDTVLFYEEEIVVESGKEIRLQGIISIPKIDKKVPAVILVHGSGGANMNEEIGPNKVFENLAHALAEKGIAVLRYDKRTFTYAGQPEINATELTLYEETIEDAISAVKLAKKDKRIDKKNIFVLGHSLGAMSAPRIGTLSKNTKGIIMMAGNARSLEQLVYEQYQYLILEDSIVTPEEESLVVNYEGQLKALEVLQSTGKSDGILPLGLPEKYWLYLKAYNQVETAKNLDKPILILQGKRDYQVPYTEFELWKKALSARQDVTFKSYEKLNHIMHEGKGKSYPVEYQKKGELPDYLIRDISAWIFDQE